MKMSLLKCCLSSPTNWKSLQHRASRQLSSGWGQTARKTCLTKEDYDEVLIPEVQKVLAQHRKVRCYYELGSEFAAFEARAMWEDFKLGIEYLSRWERVAVVSDVEWIRVAVNAFRFLIPSEIQVYGTAQAAEARSWIGATSK